MKCSCIQDEDGWNRDDCCPIHGDHDMCDCEHDFGQNTCEICLNHENA